METIAEINRRNSTPEYHDCCATHDFCDPNQAMVEALRALALEFHPALIGLINEAWTLAQQRQFRS
ncbi:MAG: hypothetical protein K8T91_18815 [Planctomycetes bacterium]|nr:hypothetical protein [Planctomycetota bacterium]